MVTPVKFTRYINKFDSRLMFMALALYGWLLAVLLINIIDSPVFF
jgi:hypothetical protein